VAKDKKAAKADNPLKSSKKKDAGDVVKKSKTLDDPSKGDQFNNEENLGRVLLIEVIETDSIKTSASDEPSDVIKANVYVVTEDDGKTKLDEPIVYEDTFLFGRVIYSSLKPKVGKYVVGVMGQGEKQKGKNPAWIIAPASDKQKKAAQAVLDNL